MKKTTILMLLMLSLLGFNGLWGTLLLEDNFSYTAGTNLTANGWTAHSGTTNPWTVANSGLTFTGYSSSGIGLAGQCTASGEDINKGFTATSTGELFVGFMFNAASTPNTTQDYILHFGGTSGTAVSTFFGRLYIQKDTVDPNKYRFGISRSSTTPAVIQWTGYNYDLGTTYLCVMKYSFIEGIKNDEVRFWVNPATNGTEPAADLMIGAADTANETTTGLASICLRQGTYSPAALYDGIRVGTTWADIFPSGTPTPTIGTTGTLIPFTTPTGTPSAAQSFTVTGSNLTANIAVAALSGYEYSTTNAAPWTTTLSLAPTYNGPVYVRLAGTTVGTYNGNIVLTSTGAALVNIAATGQVTAAVTGEIWIDATLSQFTANTGTLLNPVYSAEQTYDIEGFDLTDDITITAPANFELSSEETPTWANSMVVTSNFKTISVRFSSTTAGTFTGNISHTSSAATEVLLAVSGVASNPFQVNVNPTSLTFAAEAGATTEPQSYTLSGNQLTENIVITAPAMYEISTSSTGPWTSTLSQLPSFNGNIYVHYKPTSAGSHNGNISNVANGITTNVALTGTATAPVSNMNIQVDQTLTTNFNIIGTSPTAALPTLWKVDKNTTARLVGTYAAAASATERIGGNAMTSTAGNGIYNFGAGEAASATDRAIGFLSSSSSTKSGNIYTVLTNTGSSTINGFEISYNVEKYRSGTNAAGYSMQMYYSADGIAWTSAGTDFLTSWPADATTDGYPSAPGDTKAVVTKNLVATVNAASSIYLAWNYSVTSGTTTSFSQGLAIDDLVITAKQLAITATPTFTPPQGTYYTNQSVTITCTTPGAVIYYTTNGTDPTTSSSVFSPTTPILVNSTTTIKALATSTGLSNSQIATAVYTLPVNVANIAELRTKTPGDNTPYKLTGEAYLTLKTITRNSKYISDATGAVLIDDNSGIITTNYNLGDGITGLTGTIALYTGMLQFTPLRDPGVATSTGNVVVPETITLSQLDSSYQGKLVKVNDLTITSTTPTTFVAATNYNISDPTSSSTSKIIRTQYADLDYIGTNVPTEAKSYVGVVLQYNTTLQIVPRSLAEITSSQLPAPVISIAVTGGNVTITWPAISGATTYHIYAADIPNPTSWGTPVTSISAIPNPTQTWSATANNAKKFYMVTAE